MVHSFFRGRHMGLLAAYLRRPFLCHAYSLQQCLVTRAHYKRNAFSLARLMSSVTGYSQQKEKSDLIENSPQQPEVVTVGEKGMGSNSSHYIG